MLPLPGQAPRVATDDYRFTVRTTVEQLVDKPTDLAAQLLERQLRTIR